MKVIDEPLPGAKLIEPRVFTDHRGDFVKTFHAETFDEFGIHFALAEEFFSTSHKNVLRGMHFQLPPHDHAKLVYCICGQVLDVLVDLRKESPSYGNAAAAMLSGANHHLFFVPLGVAHGFLSLEMGSVMVYKTSTVHAPSCDAGIRWDSFGFDWGVTSPIVSIRDQAFPSLAELASPF